MVVTFETKNVGSFRVVYNPDPNPLSVKPGALPNRVNKDIVLPIEGLDLSNIGYDHITAPPGSPFDSLIEYLTQTMKDKGSSLRDTVGADFVTSRAILRELSVLPFNGPGTKMDIWAQRDKGFIFLWERESKPDEPPLQADDAKKMFAVKYKFKFYMTLDENGHARDTTKEEANNRVSFKGVFRATVKNDARKHEEAIKVFYTSPVDSIDEDEKFINIKTKKDNKVEESCHIPDWNWWLNYSQKDYVDAVLINSPYTIYGNKKFNLSGIVYEIEEKSTEDIPRDIPEDGRQWTREGCLKSLFKVLNEIKSRLADEGDALLVSINGDTVTYTTDAPDSLDFLKLLPFDH